MGIGRRKLEFLNSMVEDGPDVISKLAKIGITKGCENVSITTTLPSIINVDVFIATLQRWKNIQRYFDAPLRIWAVCYNTSVEKFMLDIVQEQENIFLTVIPGE